MTDRRKSIIWGILIIFFAFILALYLISFQAKPNSRKSTPIVPIVKVKAVNTEIIPIEIKGYGRVSSINPVTLVSEVSGDVLAGDIRFLPGETFHKGQLLLKVDDRQAKLDLYTAKSQLLNALAGLLPEIKIEFPDQFEVWQKYFDSLEFAWKLEKLPEVKEAKIKLYLARFNVYQLYFNVKNLEIKYEKYFIRAPFNGSVVNVQLRPGSTARAGSVFGDIIQTDDMEVRVEIPSTDLEWLHIGSSAKIVTDSEHNTATGIVQRIGKQIDLQTETVPVYVKIKNPENNFTSGQFVTVDFPPIEIKKAIIIPEKSMYESSFIYGVKQGMLSKIKVRPLHYQNESVVVRGNIALGDTVVVQSLQGVASGMKVTGRMEKTENE